MASLRELKRRIVSVKNTQKITRAMKLVAAAKLRKAQIAIVQNRPYFVKLHEVMMSVATRARHSRDPLLRTKTSDKVVHLVVVTSDKGLCGSLNSNVLKEAVARLKGELKDKKVEITTVGKRADQFFKRRPWTVRKSFPAFVQSITVSDVAHVLDPLTSAFEKGECDGVYAIYSEFVSVVSQRVRFVPFLPIKREEVEEGKYLADYTYEPDQAVLLHEVLRQNLHEQGFRMLLEAAASEHGARMSAMDNATRNASDLIDKLTLARNRARQEAITTELIEIVSGANALD